MGFAKLYTYDGNARSTGIRTVAAINGLELEVVETNPANGFSAEATSFNPQQKIPFIVQDDGFVLTEALAVIIYLASQNEKTTLLGKNKQEYAQIVRWMSFANMELMTHLGGWFRPLAGLDPYNKKSVDTCQANTLKLVAIIEKHLFTQTYLVGERLSVADYFTAGIVARGYQFVFDKEFRNKYPNLSRWYATVANQKLWQGKFEFIDEAIKYTPPAKPAKEAKAPKPAAAPKKKEAEPEEEDEAPPAPKPKHPLEELGRPNFVLDDWKRKYSNEDTRSAALPWFWEQYPAEEFSLWRVDYKYNEELTQVFMTSNLIGGFFNRLEASRKYIFGAASVYGKSNESIVQGAFFVRGQEWKPAFDVAPDYESYEFTKLDHNDAKDKAFVEDQWSWDKPIEVNGKTYEWADGKVFK